MRWRSGTRRRERSRVRGWLLLREAVQGIRSQPTRSTLTGLGTLVGVGAMVSVLGLTATANAQIAETFSELSSTLVKVELSATTSDGNFPTDAEQDMAALEGARAAAVVSTISTEDGASVHPGEPEIGVEPPRVSGVTAGYWDVIEAPLLEGRLIDDALADRPVAVVGERTAKRLGISGVADQILIHVGGQDFLVVGIIGPARRDQVSAGDILVPQEFVRGWLPDEDYNEQMLVTTQLGAGQVIARQAPMTINPLRPDSVTVQYPKQPRVVSDAVSADLQRLFVLLAVVSMLVGAIGIANVALMSVLERRREIGVRRALGARRRHIVTQFLMEAAILGAIGGAAGGAVGQLVVVGVSLSREWTPTLDPLITLAAAPLGMMVGVLAGILSAVRAARVPPVEALRAMP